MSTGGEEGMEGLAFKKEQISKQIKDKRGGNNNKAPLFAVVRTSGSPTAGNEWRRDERKKGVK
jgi:hypothetical protein